MPDLVRPDVRFHASFLDAMRDFIAEGRGGPDDLESALGRQIAVHSATWHDPEGFEAYLTALRAEGDPAVPPPPNWVKQTSWWYVDGPVFLGSIRIRHTLTEELLEDAGHIGYDIAPAHRLKGHGTAMLTAALPRAAALGLDRVLIICDQTNTGSRKIIEANGGQLEDVRDGRLRYWVRTD